MARASRTDILLVAAAAFCGVALISAATVGAGGNGNGGSVAAAERPPLTWEEANEVLGPHALEAPPEGAPVASATPSRQGSSASPSDQVAALRRAAGSSSGDSHSDGHSHGDGHGGHTAAGGDNAHRGDDHGHGHDGQSQSHAAGHHGDPRLADPDSYATPDHPSYDYYERTRYESLAGHFLFDELFGCNVDHPYFRWLMDATAETVREQLPTMRDALLNGFVPLGPVPNDFGYPDTYWHWINWTNSRPRFQERILEGAEPSRDRDHIVQPDELQHLLLVPAYWRSTDTAVEEGEPTDGWIVQGVMFATEIDPGPDLYPGCNPFHAHSDVDTDHMHFWVDHHVHPLAMNPKHLCDEKGKPITSFYGDQLRNTRTDWECYHDHAVGHDDHGHGEHGHDDGHQDDMAHGPGDHEHESAWAGHHPRPEPDPEGKVDVPMFHQEERQRTRAFWDVTGQISPWEINYEAPEYVEDDCGTDVGGIGVVELDPTKDCTMTHSPSFREGDPEEYFMGHGDHGPCRVEIERYDGAFDMAQRSRDVIGATYDNDPRQALADGYKPYPVAASKTFHMFSWDHWDARHDDGSPDLYNPERPAMFTYGMTDEGLMVVNIVYVFAGTEEELPDGQQDRWDEMLPRPYGCMVEWHGHNDEVEGTATGNIDGRDYMTHVWTWPRSGATWEYLGPDGQPRTYEGPYPFGEYLDGAEPHAWYRPYNYIPALCNKDGGCI